MNKEQENRKMYDEKIVKEVSFVEKELLLNSMTQKQLLKTTIDLNRTIKELTKTLKILEKHEYLTLHKNKWKLIGYNIFLGMLFAIGTVLWFLVLSWLTFNFFKDSAILNQFVQNQLKARQFDLGEIRERVKNDLTKSIQEKEAEKSSSGAKTWSGQK